MYIPLRCSTVEVTYCFPSEIIQNKVTKNRLCCWGIWAGHLKLVRSARSVQWCNWTQVEGGDMIHLGKHPPLLPTAVTTRWYLCFMNMHIIYHVINCNSLGTWWRYFLWFSKNSLIVTCTLFVLKTCINRKFC